MAGAARAAAPADEPATEGDAPVPPDVQLSLPRMGRYKIPTVRFAFGGALTMRLTSPEDVALAKALTLGAEGTLYLQVAGRETPVELGFKVVDEGGKLVKDDGSEQAQGRRRIVIGDPTVADDDADD